MLLHTKFSFHFESYCIVRVVETSLSLPVTPIPRFAYLVLPVEQDLHSNALKYVEIHTAMMSDKNVRHIITCSETKLSSDSDFRGQEILSEQGLFRAGFVVTGPTRKRDTNVGDPCPITTTETDH